MRLIREGLLLPILPEDGGWPAVVVEQMRVPFTVPIVRQGLVIRPETRRLHHGICVPRERARPVSDYVQGILEEVEVDVPVGDSGDTGGKRMNIPAHQQPAGLLCTMARPENLPPSRRPSVRQLDVRGPTSRRKTPSPGMGVPHPGDVRLLAFSFHAPTSKSVL